MAVVFFKLIYIVIYALQDTSVEESLAATQGSPIHGGPKYTLRIKFARKVMGNMQIMED
jgi:hypothetical protein